MIGKPIWWVSIIIIISIFGVLACSPEVKRSVVTGDYYGQALPDTMPILFAPGVISDGYNNRDMAISPNGNIMVYTVILPKRSGVLMILKRENDNWSGPIVAPFSGVYSDLEPAFSADGKRLYFVSNRPFKDGDPAKDYDIWYVDLANTGWGTPINPGAPVNSDKNEYYPSLTKDNVLYYTSPLTGSEDIYRSRLINGKFTEPERLSEAINSERGEFNALVAPDESFLIFGSFGRGDDIGGGDMYISFRQPDGSWSKATILDEPLNSTRLDYCPALSPDGKYFFFTSNRICDDVAKARIKSYDDITAMHSIPENAYDDIYWVNAEVLDIYKPAK